ncbi:hypothetical protein IKS57_04335, partial [bacterium]|nr:hypothetical protein [bacterium]
SLVLTAFCKFTILFAGGFSSPEKYFFNVATPELIHNNDGSLFGIKDLLSTYKCFLDSKNFLHNSLSSL